MDIVRVGWPADSVPQDLKNVLNVLGIVNSDVCTIVVAGRAATLKRQLQIPVTIKRLVAVRDSIPGYRIMKRCRYAVEQRRILHLFPKSTSRDMMHADPRAFPFTRGVRLDITYVVAPADQLPDSPLHRVSPNH